MAAQGSPDLHYGIRLHVVLLILPMSLNEDGGYIFVCLRLRQMIQNVQLSVVPLLHAISSSRYASRSHVLHASTKHVCPLTSVVSCLVQVRLTPSGPNANGCRLLQVTGDGDRARGGDIRIIINAIDILTQQHAQHQGHRQPRQ